MAAVKISGVLKDGAGKPIQNCTIQLKAKRNSTTVLVNTVASENPDEAGRYSMNVEPGLYSVSLFIEGYPPSRAGDITVYEDSPPGTLNDFLGAANEDDLRPDVIKRFEKIAGEINRLAEDVRSRQLQVAGDAEKASASAEESRKSEKKSGVSAEEARKHADAAKKSEDNARRSAQDAEQNALQTGRDVQDTASLRGEAEGFTQQAKNEADRAEEYTRQAGEHAGRAEKYANEIKELGGAGEGIKISGAPENILSRKQDGLFVNGAHRIIPKVTASTISTYLSNYVSLPDGTRVYSVLAGTGNPLGMAAYGGISIFVMPEIVPEYIYLDPKKNYISAQYIPYKISLKNDKITIEVKVIMSGEPRYALDMSTLQIVTQSEDAGIIGCKMGLRLLAGTTLWQNGIGR